VVAVEDMVEVLKEFVRIIKLVQPVGLVTQNAQAYIALF